MSRRSARRVAVNVVDLEARGASWKPHDPTSTCTVEATQLAKRPKLSDEHNYVTAPAAPRVQDRPFLRA